MTHGELRVTFRNGICVLAGVTAFASGIVVDQCVFPAPMYFPFFALVFLFPLLLITTNSRLLFTMGVAACLVLEPFVAYQLVQRDRAKTAAAIVLRKAQFARRTGLQQDPELVDEIWAAFPQDMLDDVKDGIDMRDRWARYHAIRARKDEEKRYGF